MLRRACVEGAGEGGGEEEGAPGRLQASQGRAVAAAIPAETVGRRSSAAVRQPAESGQAEAGPPSAARAHHRCTNTLRPLRTRGGGGGQDSGAAGHRLSQKGGGHGGGCGSVGGAEHGHAAAAADRVLPLLGSAGRVYGPMTGPSSSCGPVCPQSVQLAAAAAAGDCAVRYACRSCGRRRRRRKAGSLPRSRAVHDGVSSSA